MSDIDDDESCFDPTECSAERGPPHDDAGVETGGWEDEPVQAGSRASAFPIMKTDPRDIPFQSAFDRLVAAIRETLPQRYCYLESQHQIFDIIGEKVICGPLRVVAHLRDTSGDQWSYLVEFADRTGVVKELVITGEELDLRPNSLSQGLVRKGFQLLASASALSTLVRVWQEHAFGTIIIQPGWSRLPGGSLVYADPSGEVIHDPREPRSLVRAATVAGPRQVAGSLEGWKHGVAGLALGNPALTFALSLALAAPLLDLAHAPPVGVNFYGTTSSGKSTALKVMTSVYGDPAHLGSWSASRTALELSATQANDGLLTLDEFPSRPEPWRVSAIMSLGNGVGWARSNRRLTLEQPRRWRTVIASSAECSIRHFMEAAGIELPPGASVRLVDIPIRRWQHGLFNELHGQASGKAFSTALSENADDHHGHAGRGFIRWIIQHEDRLRIDLADHIQAAEQKIRDHLADQDFASSVGRVLNALAVVAVAGEYAIEAGILPWPAGTAQSSACEIAKIWVTSRDSEVSDITRSLVKKIYECRDEFQDMDKPGSPAPTQLGWVSKDSLHILPPAFAAFAGRNAQDAARDLESEGVLDRGTERNCLLHRLTVPGYTSRQRVYRLNLSKIRDLLELEDPP